MNCAHQTWEVWVTPVRGINSPFVTPELITQLKEQERRGTEIGVPRTPILAVLVESMQKYFWQIRDKGKDKSGIKKKSKGKDSEAESIIRRKGISERSQ